MTKHFKRIFMNITSQSKLAFNVYLHCEWDQEYANMLYFCEVSLMADPGIDGVGGLISRPSLIYSRPFTTRERSEKDFERVCTRLEEGFSVIPDTGLLG